MKRISLIALWIAASRGMQQAYFVWQAQGGMRASLDGCAGNRIAERAHYLAQQRKAEADWYLALDRLFPLGYSNRWNRKEAA